MKIGVIGLGYVGLPLAMEFGKLYQTVGFDINKERVKDLKLGKDSTSEFDELSLKNNNNLLFTHSEKELFDCDFYIVTVPTPIDDLNKPDLTYLENASELIGKYLSNDNIVVYESTVYPGATEEICVPILEKSSGLIFNKDFFCGYSPERVNPGDKEHKISSIKKIVSGSTTDACERVDQLYTSIIKAGTFKAKSIKIAEAAKVIENTQRDLNIALVNELSIIFNKMGINTKDVIEAAATKWNFQSYQPGIVGGHCIGVDPYYLTHKSVELGYKPEVILAGRQLNDNMGFYIADQVSNLMTEKGINVKSSKTLIMGFTFKEDCPDHRNTRVIDIYNFLKNLGSDVDVFDPWISQSEVKRDYGIDVTNEFPTDRYDSIIIAVSHDSFKKIDKLEFEKILNDNSVIYDVKSILDDQSTDGRL